MSNSQHSFDLSVNTKWHIWSI